MEVSVAAGQSSIENLSLAIETLNRMGIDAIHSVEFSLRIIENDNWSKSITTERIRVETDADPSLAQSINETGEVVVEREGIRICIKKTENEKLIVYIENYTDTNISVSAEDVKVNGNLVHFFFDDDLLAGTRHFQELMLDASDFMAFNINKVETLELKLSVVSKSDQKRIFETEPILLKFD